MKIPGLLHSIVMAFCSVNISSLIMQLVIALSLRAILSLHLALVLGMRCVHGTILDRPGSDPRLSERRTLRLKLLAAGQWADSLGCDVASDPYPSFPQSYPSIHLLLTSAQVTSADRRQHAEAREFATLCTLFQLAPIDNFVPHMYIEFAPHLGIHSLFLARNASANSSHLRLC